MINRPRAFIYSIVLLSLMATVLHVVTVVQRRYLLKEQAIKQQEFIKKRNSVRYGCPYSVRRY